MGNDNTFNAFGGQKIFSTLSYAPKLPTYVGLPVEELNKMGAAMYDLYEKNKADSDKVQLALSQISTMEVDQKHLDRVKGLVDGTLKGIYEKDNFDEASYLINKTAKDIAFDTELNQAIGVKKSYDEFVKTELAREGVPESWKKFAIVDAKNKYNQGGGVQRDPDTGAVTAPNATFTGAPKAQDISGELIKTLKGMTPDSGPVNFGTADNPVMLTAVEGGYMMHGSDKVIKFDEALNIALGMIKNNPLYTEQLAFQSKFNRGGADATLDDVKDMLFVSVADQMEAEGLKPTEADVNARIKEMEEAGKLTPDVLNNYALMEEMYNIAKPVANYTAYRERTVDYKTNLDLAHQRKLQLQANQLANAKDLEMFKANLDATINAGTPPETASLDGVLPGVADKKWGVESIIAAFPKDGTTQYGMTSAPVGVRTMNNLDGFFNGETVNGRKLTPEILNAFKLLSPSDQEKIKTEIRQASSYDDNAFRKVLNGTMDVINRKRGEIINSAGKTNVLYYSYEGVPTQEVKMEDWLWEHSVDKGGVRKRGEAKGISTLTFNIGGVDIPYNKLSKEQKTAVNNANLIGETAGMGNSNGFGIVFNTGSLSDKDKKALKGANQIIAHNPSSVKNLNYNALFSGLAAYNNPLIPESSGTTPTGVDFKIENKYNQDNNYKLKDVAPIIWVKDGDQWVIGNSPDGGKTLSRNTMYFADGTTQTFADFVGLTHSFSKEPTQKYKSTTTEYKFSTEFDEK